MFKMMKYCFGTPAQKLPAAGRLGVWQREQVGGGAWDQQDTTTALTAAGGEQARYWKVLIADWKCQ